MNIIVFSDAEQNLKQIEKELLARPYHIESFLEAPEVLDLKKYSLAAVDITGCKQPEDYPLSLVDQINQAGLPILLLAAYEQSDLLLKPELSNFDVIFYPQLSPELPFRLARMMVNKELINPANCLSVGEMILNLDKYELSVQDKPIELTYKEYELLKLLMDNQDHAFSRDKLLSMVWDYDFYGGSRTVDVHIRRLRSKLPSPYNLMLKTVRNVGYMFSPDLT
ncbi:MAG: winged helix-turn-helix domain-containing protein [Actinomycetota bacterium]|nr:winged helix-turn-helix domain-containing protein [Actinomycetota bacterium]